MIVSKSTINTILKKDFQPVNGGVVEKKSNTYFDDLPTLAEYVIDTYFPKSKVGWNSIALIIYFYLNSYYLTKATIRAKQWNTLNNN